MTFRCNGCGGRFDWKWFGAAYVYGDAKTLEIEESYNEAAVGQQIRTLCIGCHRVVKSMLLNSDLSDHWHREEGIPDEFREEFPEPFDVDEEPEFDPSNA